MEYELENEKIQVEKDGKMIEYEDADKVEIYDNNGAKVNATALSGGSVLSAYISKENNYIIKHYTRW